MRDLLLIVMVIGRDNKRLEQFGVRPGAVLFTCAAFAGPPFGEQHWHCYTDRASVEFTWPMEMKRVRFPLESFLVDGNLPPRPC